jgi:hypothetical protein
VVSVLVAVVWDAAADAADVDPGGGWRRCDADPTSSAGPGLASAVLAWSITHARMALRLRAVGSQLWPTNVTGGVACR